MDIIASLRIVNSGNGENYRPIVKSYTTATMLFSVEEPVLSNLPAGTLQTIRVHVYSVLPGGSLPRELSIHKDGETQGARAFGGFASLLGGGGDSGGNSNTIRKTGAFTYELQRTFQPGTYKITYPLPMGYGFLASFDVV